MDADLKDLWSWEDGLEGDFCSVTARAVTGADGQYLCDEIDLCSQAAIPAKPRPVDRRADQCKPKSKFRPISKYRTGPMLIKKIRNKFTGQVYDYLPIFTLDEHLEIIECVVYPPISPAEFNALIDKIGVIPSDLVAQIEQFVECS
tara:strand:- start:1850 stop:2287 length:438 start_codon:yes stop_codon:yes gene_type:complete